MWCTEKHHNSSLLIQYWDAESQIRMWSVFFVSVWKHSFLYCCFVLAKHPFNIQVDSSLSAFPGAAIALGLGQRECVLTLNRRTQIQSLRKMALSHYIMRIMIKDGEALEVWGTSATSSNIFSLQLSSVSKGGRREAEKEVVIWLKRKCC